MTGSVNRNVLLLTAFIAVAAGVCFFSLRTAAPVPEHQPSDDHPANSLPHFATMRSSHQPTAEEIEKQRLEQALEDALNSPDRCSAMASNIGNTEVAGRAMEWARSIEDEAKRKMAVESVLCAWMKFDPRAAVTSALDIAGDARGRAAALTTAFEDWAAQDPKAASAYAATLSQADQTYAISAVAPALTASNPHDAIQWAQGFDEADARNLATHAVVATWAQNAPSDAATWVATEPEGFDRADDVREVARRWMEMDANGAIEWVRSLPAGTSRDSAIDLVANQFADSNPSLAVIWGNAIDRQDLRDARLEDIAGKWLINDPSAARNWLDNAPLSDKAKSDLTIPH